MASGRTNFTAQDVATVFRSALDHAVSTADASGRCLSVQFAAKACFDALNEANEAHQIPGRGVMAVVARFDEAEDAAQVYEFTIPDTYGGPQRSAGFCSGSISSSARLQRHQRFGPGRVWVAHD